MTKRRDNFIEFVYYGLGYIKDQILPLLTLIIATLGTKNHLTPYIKLGFYIFIGVIILFSLLKWYNKVYEFDGEIIRISQGVFKKFQNDIPYNRIKSINISDSLLKRIFGICNFNIELIGGNKVVFVLRKKDVDRLRKSMFANEEITKEKTKINKFSIIEYLLLSLTSPQVFLPALSLSLTLFSFFLKLLNPRENTDDPGITGSNFKVFINSIIDPEFILAFSIIAVILLCITYLFVFVYLFLTFGNFSITSSDKGIQIKYGILKGKNYIIPKQQIRSLRIIQPFIFRRTGYVQLKVDNIGLNERSSSSVLLYPIIKAELIDSILQKHLPSFSEQEMQMRPSKKYMPNFFVSSIYSSKLIIGSLLLGFILNVKFFWLLTLLIPVTLMHGYCKWRYSAFGFNENYITIRYANKFKTTTLITLKRYVQTTSNLQHAFIKDKSIFHYRFALYSEKLRERYTCKYITDSRKKEFANYLITKKTGS
ncbi:PH domain-containing protein [Bacillus mexicanus]|uniref:PH domain-containing protein n=1 Tax=Bacillus mexicanus TaxID=2834415 RepID=UPI003D1C6C0C